MQNAVSEQSDWEETSAGFVNMFMDRLVGVEKDNQELRARVAQLEETQLLHHHALDCTLHVVLNARVLSFSDGVQWDWILGGPAHTRRHDSPDFVPLLGVYADATAWVGERTVRVVRQNHDTREICVGETAKRTTVRQLVETVNHLPGITEPTYNVDSISFLAPERLRMLCIPFFTV